MDAARLQGLAPVATGQARLLILGSFPGVASLQAQRYYAHPRNQFWPIVGELLQLDLTLMNYAERVSAVSQRGLAIWDVYASCHRQGSLDAAIREAEPNDLAGLVARLTQLRGIAHNGQESGRSRRLTQSLGVAVFQLPSTSPANASWSLARKREAWAVAFKACGLVQ
jgi:hypoxanthine-DNA glycosylase